VILVDTTVWVDLFAGRSTPHAGRLEQSLATGEDVCTCGVILTEVLQGIRADEEYRRTLARFDALLYLPMDRQLFIRAAELYRRLRHRGITIRKPVDCMIAAVAIRHDVMLLHNDRDFDPIEKHCGLKVVKVIRKPARGSR
jgi:predicted nucleic acid-binding protein